jgi:O-antigen/teichoic acid export membrane protein
MAAVSATVPSEAQDAPTAEQTRPVRDVGIQLVGRVVNLALGVVVTVVLVRALGVEGNGRWATLMAVTTIAGYLGELGMEPAAVRRAAADRAAEPAWLGALLVVRLALAIPAAAIAAAIGLALSDSPHMRVAAILLAATVVVTAPGSLRAAFQLRVRNDVPIAVMTVNSVLWTVAVVIIAAAGGSLVAFAAALLVVALVTTALQAGLALRVVHLAMDGLRDHVRDLAKVGVVVGLGSLLTLAYSKIDQALVLHYAGEHDAGLYGAAYLLLDRAQFVPAAVLTTLFPIAAASWPQDAARVRRLVQMAAEYLALVSLPALAFTIVAARPTVVTLFGKDFAGAASVLPILMAAFVSTCFGYLVGYMSVVLGLQRRFLKFALAALVFNVGLNMILIPRYGYVAAAWVTLATEALVFSLSARAALGEMRMRPALTRIARIAVAAAAVGLAAWAARALGAPFGVLVAVAAVGYLPALLVTRAMSVGELRSLSHGQVP